MSSVNAGMKAARGGKGGPCLAPLLIFDELTRGESYLYVRQCTAVNAPALLLVASNLDHSRLLREALLSLATPGDHARSETSSEDEVASNDWADSDSLGSDLSLDDSSSSDEQDGSVDWEVHIAQQARRVQSTGLKLPGFRLRDEQDAAAAPRRDQVLPELGTCPGQGVPGRLLLLPICDCRKHCRAC